MTINNWLRQAQANLETANIDTARLDCLVLLEDATGKDRAWLLAHQELPIEELVVKGGVFTNFHDFDLLLARREKHEPLAYIRGKTEFYGREFIVNNSVLEPRPESETFISLLLELSPTPCVIADIGTGSGALAITAKREIPDAQVYAIDIDARCLEVATHNARKHSADITFIEGNLAESILSKLPNTTSALLCNLPYVPDAHDVNAAALHEPHHAIFGGADGLDLFRTMFSQIQRAQIYPTYILTESLPTSHHALQGIAEACGYVLQQEDDFIQLFAKV